jgi:hypothetical protein
MAIWAKCVNTAKNALRVPKHIAALCARFQPIKKNASIVQKNIPHDHFSAKLDKSRKIN